MSVQNTRGCKLVKVADYADLVDEEPAGMEVAGEDVMVVRIGDAIYALGNICSHAEAWLDSGELHVDTMEIECPLHDGKFDLRSGQATALPCVEPVRKYDVVVEGTDVFIAVPESEQ